MLSHAAARAILTEQFRTLFERDAAPAELQAAQAVALLETGYGSRWKRPGVGSHNWGAVQTRRGVPCFRYVDHHRDGRAYVVCFRRYPDDGAGARDMLRVLYSPAATLEAASSGSALTFARAMSAAGYFEARPEAYAGLLRGDLGTIAPALGEPIYLDGDRRDGAGVAVLAAAAVGVAAALAAAGRKRWATFAALTLLPP